MLPETTESELSSEAEEEVDVSVFELCCEKNEKNDKVFFFSAVFPICLVCVLLFPVLMPVEREPNPKLNEGREGGDGVGCG